VNDGVLLVTMVGSGCESPNARLTMPTVEERISSLEAKVDAIADLRNAIGELGTDLRSVVGELRTDMNRRFEELRTDMNRQFGEVRADMNRRFSDVDRRFERMDRRTEILDQRMERHFMWMVGIQFTVLIAVIVALIQMAPR